MAHSRSIVIGLQCFIKKNGKYLMLRRHDTKNVMPGVWMAPGGTREENEGLFACARREILEETGLKIKHLKLRAVGCAYLRDLSQEIHFHFLTADYAGGKLNPEPEVGILRWIAPNNIFELDNLLAEHKHVLPHVFGNKSAVLSFRSVYKKGNELEELLIEKP